MKHSTYVSLTILIVGLSIMALGPYGGCSCNNPLGPSGGPSPTPTPTQGPSVDTWEDGDFLNEWGGSATAVKDTFGTTLTFSLTAPGNPTGTSGGAMRYSGTIMKDGPPNYPYAQVQMSLGSTRNMLTTFSSYNGVRFSYKWSGTVPPGASFFVIAATPTTVFDFGWFRYQVMVSDNLWHTVNVYFPNKVGAPKFAQPGWAASKPWTTSPFSGQALDRIDFSIQPIAGSSSAYDLTVDDVTFF